MASKNIIKFNNLNLGVSKRIPKGYAPHRHVTLSKQWKRKPQKKEPNFSKFLSKDSAVSMIKEAKSQKTQLYPERRFEFEQAKVQLRKCNELIKEHYLQRREEHEKLLKGGTQKVPILSKKLIDIMAANLLSNIPDVPKQKDLRQAHGFASKSNIIDFKPQQFKSLNRWQIKFPAIKQSKTKEVQSTDPEVTSHKRPRKVKPPEIQNAKKLTPAEPKESKEHEQVLKKKTKPQNMWLIGTRNIPRLID